jgi:hypothetical protein
MKTSARIASATSSASTESHFAEAEGSRSVGQSTCRFTLRGLRYIEDYLGFIFGLSSQCERKGMSIMMLNARATWSIQMV